jgi:hypothetical protein
MHKITVSLAILLAASMAHAQATYTDNIVIVLDASGSMNDRMQGAGGRSMRKIDAAKAALREAVKRLPPGTNIGLLVFSARNVTDDWVYPLGPRDEAKLLAAIDLPEPGRGTPLGTYMKIGADRLLAERQKQRNYGSYRMLVVTDGEANEDRKPECMVDFVTGEMRTRGIRVDAIGVAMDARHTLATQVNSYRSADNPTALAKAIHEVLAERLSTSDKDDEKVYRELAGLPDNVAVAMVQALSAMPNQPIGGRSPLTPAEGEPPQAGGQAGTPAGVSAETGGGALLCLAVAIVLLVVIFLVVKGHKKSQRRRNH